MTVLSEADTRAKLIDPAIHKRGWTEDLIRREETAGSIEIIGGKALRRSRGKVDYVLRIKVNPSTQPVAVALIEAKKDTLPPGHGLDQAKGYAVCKRLNVPFVSSSNGHQFIMFDCFSGFTTALKRIMEATMLKTPASTLPRTKPLAWIPRTAILNEQMDRVEQACKAVEEEQLTINTFPTALLRRAFAGEL